MICYYAIILKLILKKYLMLTVAYFLSFRHNDIREQCIQKILQKNLPKNLGR